MKISPRFILLFFSSIIGFNSQCNFIFSQQVQQEWVKRFDDSTHGQDNNGGLALDSTGNVYITGVAVINGQHAIATVKYSSAGIQQWVAYYEGNGDNQIIGHGIVSDLVGNTYINSTNGNVFTQVISFLMFKYNTNGVLQWARYYGDNVHTYTSQDIIMDKDGNIYQVGETNVSGPIQVLVVKYNPSGDTLWTRIYAYPGQARNYSQTICIDSLNNLIVAGACAVNNTGILHGLIIKYNSLGTFLWSNLYSAGVNIQDHFIKVGSDSSGNIYAVGESESYGAGFLTVKYSSSGIQQWVRNYRGTVANGTSSALALGIDIQNNVYITGLVQDSGGHVGINADVGTIKYNSNGDSLWVRIYDGYGYGDGGDDITLDNKGSVYVFGGSDSASSSDIIIIKYNNQGVQQWITRYPGSPSNIRLAMTRNIEVDNSKNVFVVGDNSLNGTGSDYATIKYSQLIGIKKISSEIANHFSLYQNYPNPFNPKTIFRFDIPKESYTKLIVYDMIGREVGMLVNEKFQPGKYEIEWDAGNFASGVYFYRLVTDSYSVTMKMVVLK